MMMTMMMMIMTSLYISMMMTMMVMIMTTLYISMMVIIVDWNEH